MGLFLATTINRIDKKGRVSVPAPFRAAASTPDFQGVVLSPSHKYAALDGFSMSRLEQVSASLDHLALYSDEQEMLATTVFGAAQPLMFDSEGRITLPADLSGYAGLTESVAFVGLGRSFQMWEPGRLKDHMEKARKETRSKNLTLKMQDNSHG